MRDLPRFLRYFRRRPGAYTAGFCAMLASTGLFLAMPGVVRRAIEELGAGVTRERLFRLAGVIVLLAVGDAIALFLTRRILIGASRDIEYEMRRDLFDHLLRLPPPWYRKNRVGDLMSRAVNDLSAVRMLLGPGIMQAANTLFVGIAALALMFSVSPPLTLVALAVFPVIAIATKVMGQATHRRFTKIQEFFSEISAEAQENFSGVRLVRAFAREKSEEARFDANNREFRRRNLGLARLNALFFPLLQFLVGVGFALTLWAGGRFILAGKLSVARYVEFNLYMLELIWPAIALGWVVNLGQRGAASWNRMVDLWDAMPLPAEEDTGERLPGDVEFRELSFAHGERSILTGVSLRVAAGTTVAIVGRTGAGKSTLLNLLLRLDDPPAGTIFVGGRDLTTIPLPVLRRNVAAVPQETFLFSDTLANNVAFGRPDATRAEIERAVQDAGLAPDVARFPKGLDTIVGERGITLSGGQKQRTALARALLTDAPILVLDDAFSSVDTETEAKILEGLKGAAGGRTVFLVSHRLSTLQNADVAAVLDGGRVVETGTHAELLAMGGLYAAIAERQRLAEEMEAA
ncbi:MAG: ABC transporter ATP-binding protein [Acidobacteriota bacterium]|nr:ABC transporter ATP-binding protein [Acidobacteriota bacterium]